MLDLFNTTNPFGEAKYIIRSTGEEVEVITFGLKEQGDRSDDDWVTYIDSEGKEHLREHLNIQLDFKATNAIAEIYKKFIDLSQSPSTDNNRIFETSKELLANKSYSVDNAVSTARELVTKVKDMEL